MLDDLEYDDSESPAIALVPAGVPWEDIQDHIKIAHHPLVVLPAGGTEYAGAYWTGAAMTVIEDLGADQDQAIGEFRQLLRERGKHNGLPEPDPHEVNHGVPRYSHAALRFVASWCSRGPSGSPWHPSRRSTCCGLMDLRPAVADRGA